MGGTLSTDVRDEMFGREINIIFRKRLLPFSSEGVEIAQ
jgi:hypothetical protein